MAHDLRILQSIRSVLQLRRTWSYYRQIPMLASLELTHRCNLQCQMCNLWSGAEYQGKREKELSFEDWQKVIDGLAVLGTREVTLIGAEPLVRNDVADIAAYVKSKGMICALFTNGLLLQTKARSLVSAGVDVVNVSIDAPGTLHDEIRGMPGAFERSMIGIRNLIEARCEAGQQKPWISLHTTVSATNSSVIAGMISLRQSLGVDGNFFGYLVEVPRDVAIASDLDGKRVGSERMTPTTGRSYLLSASQVPMLRSQIEAVCRENGDGMGLDLLKNLPDSYLLTGRVPIQKCHVLRTRIIVDPYGDVIPCPFLDGYHLGNVRETTLMSVWYDNRYQTLRRAIDKRLLPICQYCCYFRHNLTMRQSLRLVMNRSLVP